ncbi:hypothetical protein NA56DRAFT_98136 [Hyaloscypha hepaticicola]|uniref:Amino acid permease/ SLC12A domain-containing protein n=1 Tax=Hyaloscypha hepaticicola TaxID=2082293 RepID=A0A2J6Q7L3_9HELO|nr:hypothetical protein NA56DRAFT_98136 [Hyaloscypha hepaticicola]
MVALGAPVAGSLVRGLGTWQILFIAIGGTIGLGFATTTGEVLAISGPAGVLTAFAVVGIVAIAVMEGICEMIVLWPISNAMIEFVRTFVDRDLAIVVGIAYWYTYSITMAALIIESANLLTYWSSEVSYHVIAILLFLLVIFAINSRGVKVFGWIELFGGILKVLFVLAIFILMICVNTGAIGNARSLGAQFFNDGFQNNPSVAKTKAEAVLVSIPLAIFSYIGVELLTVTAFEAANPSRLKGPTKHIAYIITVIYLVTIGGFVANLEWFNQNLPNFIDQSRVSLNSTNVLTGRTPHEWGAYSSHNSTAAPIIALLQVGLNITPAIINGILIYAGLSTANTALYVASRTMYGLTRDLSSTSENIMVRIFAKLNTVSPTTRIPVWALIVSCLAFACWTPWIKMPEFNSTSATDTPLWALAVSDVFWFGHPNV